MGSVSDRPHITENVVKSTAIVTNPSHGFTGWMNVTWYAFWYSIDRAVPPLHIDDAMGQYSVLTPGARAYFYFHRGLGMIILSFFVAGITGLFK